eukprot:scaffold2107_cov222-Pinguiococcus_pyrenoidosus.AAC.4
MSSARNCRSCRNRSSSVSISANPGMAPRAKRGLRSSLSPFCSMSRSSSSAAALSSSVASFSGSLLAWSRQFVCCRGITSGSDPGGRSTGSSAALPKTELAAPRLRLAFFGLLIRKPDIPAANLWRAALRAIARVRAGACRSCAPNR